MPSIDIVPHPAFCELHSGRLALPQGCRIQARDAYAPADLLAKELRARFGIASEFADDNATIELNRELDAPSDNPEGYALTIDSKRVLVSAASEAGLFYGAQSLVQCIDGHIEYGESPSAPCLTIRDEPRYSWRGLHLDVCRHFFDVAFIETLLDRLAEHKLNTFHWHLTEDQGWRLAVHRYPRLAEISAWRSENGARYGGYYTRDEVRRIVDYAARRHITVVPEIELPGHALAALAAYPELSCTGGPFEVTCQWGIFDDVYCAGKESTFEFLEVVLDEVLELFPSPFIHIGGDECPKVRWRGCDDCRERMRTEGLVDADALQSWFVGRIGCYLAARGRRLIGWDEILEGGLPANASVMSWRGMQGGIAAAEAGHDVVMTPTDHCYFDYRQCDDDDEPGFHGVNTLRDVYALEPTPCALSEARAHHILGTQANVWTERMHTPSEVEFMTLPRMSALAEVAWSPAASRDYGDFVRRLARLARHWRALGLNYRAIDNDNDNDNGAKA